MSLQSCMYLYWAACLQLRWVWKSRQTLQSRIEAFQHCSVSRQLPCARMPGGRKMEDAGRERLACLWITWMWAMDLRAATHQSWAATSSRPNCLSCTPNCLSQTHLVVAQAAMSGANVFEKDIKKEKGGPESQVTGVQFSFETPMWILRWYFRFVVDVHWESYRPAG